MRFLFQGKEASREKQFLLNVITSLIWDFFQILFSHIQRIFKDSYIFEETTFLHFFRVTTSTQKLLFWSSYFFRDAIFSRNFLFKNSHLFAAVIFFRIATLSEQKFYRQPLLENRYFFRADSFLNTELFGVETVYNKDIFRRGTFLNQMLLHNFFRKVTFWNNIPHCLHFLDSYIFRVTTFSEEHTSQHTFSKEILFRSYYYTSYLSVSN